MYVVINMLFYLYTKESNAHIDLIYERQKQDFNKKQKEETANFGK